MAIIVTNRPEMLIGVSGSLNTMAAAEIVITSLKMPQIDSVTTEVRFKSLRDLSISENGPDFGWK